jgi:molybdenum cofactor cytidylyltransferase
MQAIAVIPAAGRSQRMGRPKLLLPWGSITLIEHVIATWQASRVKRVFVVVHPGDDQLARLVESAGAQLVQPAAAPAEMKDSVRLALEAATPLGLQPDDAWLMAPADMPGLSAATIDGLIAAYAAALAHDGPRTRIFVPRSRGRRGHPVLFAWSLAADVGQLPPGQGLNALFERYDAAYLDVEPEAIPADLDTSDDYDRLRREHGA